MPVFDCRPARLFFGLPLAALLVLTGCGSEPSADETAAEAPSFDEPYRPQFHYTPRRNWMNDPNGLVYHDGTFLLFHQHNPEDNTWGHMSWNHATSTDLTHWAHEGVAIPEAGNEMIFSGSAVVDHDNTAGFGEGPDAAPLVAVYTSHYTLAGASIDQAQSLAYSTDGGESWTKYEGNPVLEHPDPDFRDPNVFWYEPEQKWVMTVALPTQHTVQFYESTDLNPGTVAGGSGAQYFLGRFDGRSFTPREGSLESAPHWVDYGPDFYATIPWNNVPEEDGRALWLARMNNWDYAERIPTSPWRSAQSIPRAVQVRTIDGTARLARLDAWSLRSIWPER